MILPVRLCNPAKGSTQDDGRNTVWCSIHKAGVTSTSRLLVVPSFSGLTLLWNLGSALGTTMTLQIISGIMITTMYRPSCCKPGSNNIVDVTSAFYSIVLIIILLLLLTVAGTIKDEGDVMTDRLHASFECWPIREGCYSLIDECLLCMEKASKPSYATLELLFR